MIPVHVPGSRPSGRLEPGLIGVRLSRHASLVRCVADEAIAEDDFADDLLVMRDGHGTRCADCLHWASERTGK